MPDSGVGLGRSFSVMVAMSSLLFMMFFLPDAVTVGPAGNSPTQVKALALTAHDPILIDGNSGFTNASGVTWGSGTASDPYVIEEWDVNASTADGISIQDTDAHFIIRNCYVHFGSWIYTGIHLFNCVNGTLENNTCVNTQCGMILESSSDNMLSNNTCSSNDNYGIILYLSSNNTLSNNSCSSEDENGMALILSSNNTLSDNNCTSNNFGGIGLESSSNNTLSNNNCSNNDLGIGLHSSSDNMLSNNTCSSNYYYHGVYLYSSSDNTLVNNICSSNHYDGVRLYLSSDNALVNNTCSSNNQFGVYLESSSSNTLSSNNCSYNGYDGICFGSIANGSSDNNEVSWNQIYNNIRYGVNISYGSGNRVWENTLVANNGAASTYDVSHVQACDDGMHNWWNSTDGYGNYWSDWTTPDVVPPFGIVELPYNISGSADAKDYYPLTTPGTPIPEFSMMPFVVIALLAVIVFVEETRRKKRS